ncbi:MAG: glycine zipper domain-containing protein [Bacteroidales bacterium]
MLRKGVAVAALVVAVAGCSSSGPSNGQLYGTAGGAALGAGIGRAVAATATQGTWVGALGGAVIGYAIGTYMDPPAEEKHARATISVAEDGKPVSWTTEKGSKGAVVATGSQYADRAGRPCRPLKQDVTMGDEHMAREVTACQAKDGTWIVTDYQPERAD